MDGITAQESTNVFRGATLYNRLALHDAEMCGQSPGRSNAEARMKQLSERLSRMNLDACDPEKLYQVGIWELIESPDYFGCGSDGAAFLAHAAKAGHKAARFVLAKAVSDCAWWAEDEMRHISPDGNAQRASKQWLKALADEGYSDAAAEYACFLWREGREEEAFDLLVDIGQRLPEAKVKAGLLLLATDSERALSLIDEGEHEISSNGSMLNRLDQSLAITKGGEA